MKPPRIFLEPAFCIAVSIVPCIVHGKDNPPAPSDAYARIVKDSEALARLQAPGEVLFQDDFENAASLDKYFEVRGRNEGRVKVGKEAGEAYGGVGSLKLIAPANHGNESSAGVTAWLGDEGVDSAYLRYYIHFASDYDQGDLNHTAANLMGVAGTNKWKGMGTAGHRPKGDDYFSCRFETWRDWGQIQSPGYLYLYTYWMEMKQNRDGHYWGNMLEPEKERRFVPVRGKWYCLEQMISLNTPGKADGELAAWIDGKLYLYFTGIRWRSDAALKIKRIDLGAYIHKAVRDNTVWFDDAVVSTGYVGPMERK